MAIGKIIKEGAKAVTKRGRKTKAQRAAETRKRNAAAKKAATKGAPKKKMAMKPGTAQKRDTLGIRGNLKGLTDKQKRERLKLINQIKKEMEMAKKGITKQETIQSRIPVGSVPKPKRGQAIAEGAYQEGPNTVLPSKIKLPEKLKDYSRAQIRRLVRTGQARIVKTKDGSRVQTTGRFAPPASMIREAAGEGSRSTRVRKDTRTLGQKMKAAQRRGEPTSMKELKKRQAEAKSKEINNFFKTEKEAIKDAGKTIKNRIKRVEEMAKKGTISLSEAKRRTKRIKKSAMKEIKYQKGKPKNIIVPSLSEMTMITKHKKGGKVSKKETELEKFKFVAKKLGQTLKLPYSAAKGKNALIDNMADMYDIPRPTKKSTTKKSKGGKVTPRGCGAAMRGYGKAMKKGAK